MIHRCKSRPSRYLIVSKALIDDNRLSLTAIGIMAYLMGRPPNWEIKIVQLAQRFNLSQDRIGTIFKELEKLGYARLVSVRQGGKTQFTGKQWEVFELPELNLDFKNNRKTTVVHKSETVFSRQPKKPDVGESRLSESPALIKTEKEEEKEKNIIKIECENERVEDTTHTDFLNSFSSSNEKKGPSPQSSGEPPSPCYKASDDKETLFRDSVYVKEPDGVKRLRADLIDRHPRYEAAHTLHYYKRLLNWSDEGEKRSRNWVAKAASFIDGDQVIGKLVTAR